MLGNIMNALMQPNASGQTGADMLAQAVGSMMGSSGGGGTPVNQLLGGLQQVMSAKPGSSNVDSSSPIMGLLGPIATAVAGKTGIPPAVATTVAATAMHYLVSSHPAAGGSGPLNMGEVAQQMASGSVSQQTLQSSGMVNAVVKSTGLSPADASKSLDAAFNHLQGHVRLAGKQTSKKFD
jgi:hypothetical protein